MNRRLFLLASAFIAIMTFALGTAATTNMASAQAECCLRISNETRCHAIILVETSLGVREVLMDPHSHDGFTYRCDLDPAFAIRDACGIDHRLTVGERIRVLLRGGCCAVAVLTQEGDCYYIRIVQIDEPCNCP